MNSEGLNAARTLNSEHSVDATAPSKTLLKPLESRDLFSLRLITDPRISPDGNECIFTLTTIDPEKNEYKSHLALVTHDQPAKVEILTREGHEGRPSYAPDGKRIAFIGDGGQLYILPRDGGEAKKITRFKTPLSDYAWSPDGKSVAFTALVKERGLIPEDEKPEEDPYKKYTSDVKVVNRANYKQDGAGIVADQRSHIFTIDLATAKITQITSGNHDSYSPRFSPDSRRIVFSSNRNPNADHEAISHIYHVSSLGGEILNLTPGEYYFTKPAFSPNGQWIAFLGTQDGGDPLYTNSGLWVISANGEKMKCLTRTYDRPMGIYCAERLQGVSEDTPQWSSNNERIYMGVSDSGTTHLIDVELATGVITPHFKGEHVVYSWSISLRTEKAVLAVTDPRTPNDLWSGDLRTGRMEKLTATSSKFNESIPLAVPEPMSTTSKDGTSIQGWIFKPPRMDPHKKYPMILEIHGGPMGMYAANFKFQTQLLAQQGYVVLQSNPRGSQGFGQSFCQSIKGDWGNLDFQDLMAFVDEAVKLPYVDANRLGIVGASYGGYMTNWIIAHSDRFRAAVTMDCDSNIHSSYGTSDQAILSDLVFGFEKETKTEDYLRHSPISYVDRIRTPLLLLHSEEDQRCSIEQAEQLFTALKKLRREVVFVRFPGESHLLARIGKPWHRIFRYDQIIQWFKEHL